LHISQPLPPPSPPPGFIKSDFFYTPFRVSQYFVPSFIPLFLFYLFDVERFLPDKRPRL
jgi:hypothetical protein